MDVDDIAGVDIAAHHAVVEEVAGSLPVLEPCMAKKEWIPFKALSH